MYRLVLLILFFSCCNCFASSNKSLNFSEVQSQAGLSKQFSFGGVELKLSNNNLASVNQPASISTEISLFSSFQSSNKFKLSSDNNRALKQQVLPKQNFNRYKNTIPAVYKLTLKGYSIMEYSNYETNTWSLNKSDVKAIRKPEIMFSITKQF